MGRIRFAGSLIKASGKKGVIAPDADGYRQVCVGALNAFNSRGEYYIASGAKRLFLESSAFMRQVLRDGSYAEAGHPVRPPNMKYEDWYRRFMRVEISRVCGHFRKFELDTEFGRKNPGAAGQNTIAVYGEVIPTGVLAAHLENAFKNSFQNLCFSVRGVTNDVVNPETGVVERELTNIIAYDAVLEPGIAVADRIYSPACEGYGESKESLALMADINSEIIHVDVMKRVLLDNLSPGSELALEESGGREFNEELLRAISQTKEIRKRDARIFTW